MDRELSTKQFHSRRGLPGAHRVAPLWTRSRSHRPFPPVAPPKSLQAGVGCPGGGGRVTRWERGQVPRGSPVPPARVARRLGEGRGGRRARPRRQAPGALPVSVDDLQAPADAQRRPGEALAVDGRRRRRRAGVRAPRLPRRAPPAGPRQPRQARRAASPRGPGPVATAPAGPGTRGAVGARGPLPRGGPGVQVVADVGQEGSGEGTRVRRDGACSPVYGRRPLAP